MLERYAGLKTLIRNPRNYRGEVVADKIIARPVILLNLYVEAKPAELAPMLVPALERYLSFVPAGALNSRRGRNYWVKATEKSFERDIAKLRALPKGYVVNVKWGQNRHLNDTDVMQVPLDRVSSKGGELINRFAAIEENAERWSRDAIPSYVSEIQAR